jgi:hypothetical protein
LHGASTYFDWISNFMGDLDYSSYFDSVDAIYTSGRQYYAADAWKKH